MTVLIIILLLILIDSCRGSSYAPPQSSEPIAIMMKSKIRSRKADLIPGTHFDGGRSLRWIVFRGWSLGT